MHSSDTYVNSKCLRDEPCITPFSLQNSIHNAYDG